MKQKPGKNKNKQEQFKKCYVQIWEQILEILKTDSAVRAHVHYMPQLQLIRELVFILIQKCRLRFLVSLDYSVHIF